MLSTKHIRVLVGLGALVLAAIGCSDSDSDVSVDSAAMATAASSAAPTTAAPTTAAPTTAAPTTAAPTTAAPTTAAPTTAAPTTAAPTPTGPAVDSVTTPKANLTCNEVTAQGNMATVSWSVTGAASVTIAIDNPAGAYVTDLPVAGSTQIPATCGDTQDVFIVPVAADGTAGTPEKITITVDA